MGAAPVTRTPVERPDRLLKELVGAYRRHLQRYERWLGMAESAEELLDGERLDEFLSLHEQKQAVAVELQEEEQRLRRQRERLTSSLGLESFTLQQLEAKAASLPEADSEAFQSVLNEWRGLLDELSAVMQKVAKAERQIEGKLREMLRTLLDSASDARTTRRAVRAYFSDGEQQDARFIDRRS